MHPHRAPFAPTPPLLHARGQGSRDAPPAHAQADEESPEELHAFETDDDNDDDEEVSLIVVWTDGRHEQEDTGNDTQGVDKDW